MGVVVARDAPPARAARRDQDAAPRARGQTPTSSQRFVREARAAARLHERARRARPRRRRARGRRAVHRDGVPRGQRSRMRLVQRSGPLVDRGASTTCSRRARRSPRRTRSGSSIAISSRRTCSSRSAATAATIVKVLDFGISKALDGIAIPRSPTRDAAARLAARTCRPSRSSVEATSTRAPTSGRSASSCYFLLTGKLPFDGDSMQRRSRARSHRSRRAPSRASSRRSRGARAVVKRCLAKDREGRYPTVGELAHALAPFAHGGATAAQRVSSMLRLPVAPVASSAVSGMTRAAGR